MADPGPSRQSHTDIPDYKTGKKRKLSSNEENENPSSKLIIKEEQPDTTQMKRNMSGIKSFLHGISYQIKLCIYVCLTNAKKSVYPKEGDNDFSFTVTSEDSSAGKFDDIVCSFKDGNKTGNLNIQAKHKSGSSASKITLDDLKTTSETNNPYAILKYFTSFLDHNKQQPPSDVEGFIICTNSDITENAKDMLKTIELPTTDEPTNSLDLYIFTLFGRIRGKCYGLDYDKLCAKDSTLSHFYQLLKQCSECTRLAMLLVEDIKSKEKITRSKSLYKDYRPVILYIIDSKKKSTDGSYRFTSDFLDSTHNNSIPGYKAFREEFENQYRKEFLINGSVWDDLKGKFLYVAKAFLSDRSDESSSLESFPDENVEESIKSFCEKFRFWCDTKSENQLDDTIITLWQELYYRDDHLVSGLGTRGVEGNVASKMLFKTNFNWLLDPFAKPLHSEDILKDLETIKNTLAHMQLKGISDKLHKKIGRSQFRINSNIISNSDFYEQIEYESLLKVEAYDVQFVSTLLVDILALQSKAIASTFFIDDSDLTNDSNIVETVFRCCEQAMSLVIICNEGFTAAQRIVRQWKKASVQKASPKTKVFLIQKTDNISADLSEYRIRNLTEESWEQIIDKDINLCSTSISPSMILQNIFLELPIEKFIMLLDWGEDMEENNQIAQKYREIENTYVPRIWIYQENQLKADMLERSDLYEMTILLQNIRKPQEEIVSFMKITENVKNHLKFKRIFPKPKTEHDYEPIVGDDSKKVSILLGEAGFGKSTNLTWLAWHLRKRNPSSWVVRCNLSDHCTDFKPFIQNLKNVAGTAINENEAFKMLYRITQRSLQLDRDIAEKGLKCIILSHGFTVLNKELMEFEGISLKNSIQLVVFTEKFNAGELVLLFDGFDEIAPHYKEVVLKFLSMFEEFNGVRKLYITSRPYGFKEQFKTEFKEPAFFQLKPLLLQDKGSMLYKMIVAKWHNENISDKEISVFFKALCVTQLYFLGDLNDIPLNLMMSVDILIRLADQYVLFPSKTICLTLFIEIERIFKPSLIVDEFLVTKIGYNLYNKIGADASSANNPREIERYEKTVEEVKLQHGLVALWILCNDNERDNIFSETEKCEVEDCINKMQEAKEKTGIVNDFQDGNPMFIHRSFVEYLAAWWVVKRRIEGQQQGKLKTFSLVFWNQLRKYIDTILTKRHPTHFAIVQEDWEKVKSLLDANSLAFNQRDDGNRTPLHLLVCYWPMPVDSRQILLSESIESAVIKAEENIFGWTALDHAFHVHADRHIFYLLHHGASINSDALYEQVVRLRQVDMDSSARYARYVMIYLSRHAIEYKSNDSCRKMKEFCDKVGRCLINETFERFGPKINSCCKKDEHNEFSDYEKSILEVIIAEDAVWLLDSIMQQVTNRVRFTQMVGHIFLNFMMERKSIGTLQYLLENESSFLNDVILSKCIVNSVVWDYKNEFKWFFDHHCTRLDIKDFKPCSIQSQGGPYYIIKNLNKDSFDGNYRSIENILLNIPTEIVIDKNILSVLLVCLVTKRPSMLRYLKDSCSLKLGAGHVYYLASITEYCLNQFPFTEDELTWYHPYKKRQTFLELLKSAFDCLLAQAMNISGKEMSKMLRLAIKSNLFEFSKCLVDNIDFQAVDELNKWDLLHLCVSQPYSDDDNAMKSMLELFQRIFNKMEIDCYGKHDQNGRSVLHLAFENQHDSIAQYIVAQKLGVDDLKEIRCLVDNDALNLVTCCRAIDEISKSVKKKRCFNELGLLAAEITNFFQLPSTDRSLLKQHIEELYQIAKNSSSSSLMYYLNREFGCTISQSIHGADWFPWIVNSLKARNFQLFKWTVNQYCEGHQLAHPNGKFEFENFGNDDTDNDHPSCMAISLEQLIEQIEMKLSSNRSKDELCVMKLIVLTVYLKHESAIRYLCETFEVNINQEILFDIMEIVHLVTDWCKFEKLKIDRIYKYLFDRISNFHDIDAFKNILHFATKSGPNCMTRFLFKNNRIIETTIINGQDKSNVFHYYLLRDPEATYCYTINPHLFHSMLGLVLKSNENTVEGMSKNREKKIKELCFISNHNNKSVIQVAVESGNIGITTYIILIRLGITNIDKHNITDEDECLIFKECYDVIFNIGEKLPFNAEYENLLDRLAKPIDSFSLNIIKNVTKQKNVGKSTEEDTCRAAIRYRSVLTLEHLVTVYEQQAKKTLANSTSRELVACMMEYIRQNRSSMFKILVGHYATLQDIQSSVEVEYEHQENSADNSDYESESDFSSNSGSDFGFDDESRCEYAETIDKCDVQWALIDPTATNLSVRPDYLPLLIMLVADGTLSMMQYFVKMLKLKINKSLILLIIKVSKGLSVFKRLKKMKSFSYLESFNLLRASRNSERALIFEYLASTCEGKPNLLHLCAQSNDSDMIRYLITDKLQDPNVIDSQNGWNAGHSYVSEPATDDHSWNAFHVIELLIDKAKMDCFALYDQKGRSVLHLAMENGHTRVVECIIKHKLGIKCDKDVQSAINLLKIEEVIIEMHRLEKFVPGNQKYRDILQKLIARRTTLTSWKQLGSD